MKLFRNRPAAMDPETYVRALYRNVLGREADPEGLATYSNLLREEGDATRILSILLSSEEYLAAPRIPAWPHWCQVKDALPSNRDSRRPLIPLNAEGRVFDSKILRHGERPQYDIQSALATTGSRHLALIFFMGLGDYLMITPFLSHLRQLLPDVHLIGAVSSNSDSNNSPLVADLLSQNPAFDEVTTFKGIPSRTDWRHYDYSDALASLPPDTVVVPLIYEYSHKVRHRLFEMYHLFGLPEPKEVIPPLLHLPKIPSSHVKKAADQILSAGREVVFLHTETRSSNYAYKYAPELIEALVRQSKFVVTPNCLDLTDLECDAKSSLFHIDTKTFGVIDSIFLFKILADALGPKFLALTTPSLFWHVSAALQTRNVSLHHRYDGGVHNTHYNNITMISYCDYPVIPREKLLVCPPTLCYFDHAGYCHYDYTFVMSHISSEASAN